MEQQVDSGELIEAMRQTIASLIQENLTLKLILGKIEAGDKPQQ